jgi:hypothetical protein
MKRLCAALVLLLMVIPMAALAASSTDQTSSAVQSDEAGEGLIQKITENEIVVNDIAMVFPDSIQVRSGNGDTIPRSRLRVGDKVFYHADSKRVILFIGKFDRK